MSVQLKVLVLTGNGILCAEETSQAFKMAKFDVDIRHLNDLITEGHGLDQLSRDYGVLAFPGGCSYGDYLSVGKILALKVLYQLKWNLVQYVTRGGLVLGISNGFQALMKMGIFGPDVSMTHNLSGKFLNTWVKVTPQATRCVWLKGLGTFDLPIRHKEGRIILSAARRSETLIKMDRFGTSCLKYEENPNGSEENLAGLCDLTGRILGLMPHPESFVRWSSHPSWTAQASRASAPGQGLLLFENAYYEATHGR